MAEVTLAQVLEAREIRAARQQELLAAYGKPLICFTMNIAGPMKVDEYTEYAFRVGCVRLLEGLRTMGYPVILQEDISSGAGFCLMIVADADAQAVKRLCVQFEDRDPLGRLFDMDVIAPEGFKLERAEERCCLVCGAPGRGCASRRLHPLSELQAATRRVIREHKRLADSERMASLAVQSLLDEVCATPKPGLVDRHDNGSHRDMDIFTFNASAAALWPYFQKCFLAGIDTREQAPAVAFDHLNALGVAAEGTMRRTTANVNTHKGAIYTLGILCGAAGRVWSMDKPQLIPWLAACADLGRDNAGPGVRAEVAAGLPSVREVGLPALAEARERGLSFNDQCLYALLRLLAKVRDTNMAARGGAAQAEACRAEAARLAEQEIDLPQCMKELNDLYIQSNLSPGGCADLLAATLLADRWTRA